MRRDDVERFRQIVGVPPGENWWDEELEDPAPGIIEVGVFEANYGWRDERSAAAKAGIPFLGWHAEGGEYGSYEFLSLDGEMQEAACDRDGNLTLAVNRDLTVMTDQLALRRYITALRQVQKLFGIVSDPVLPLSGMSDSEYVEQGGLKCPYCSSSRIEPTCAPVVETREAWQDIRCAGCGKEWRDRYDLTGYEDLQEEGRRAA